MIMQQKNFVLDFLCRLFFPLFSTANLKVSIV